MGGVPASFIKNRFDKDIIEVVSCIDYSKLNDEIIKENIDIFNKTVDDEVIGKIKKLQGEVQWILNK